MEDPRPWEVEHHHHHLKEEECLCLLEESLHHFGEFQST